MKTLYVLLFVALSISWTESRHIEFENRCGYDIWVNPLTNALGPALDEGIVRLSHNARFTYQIPDKGWYVYNITFVCLSSNISNNLLNSIVGVVVSGPNPDVIAVDTTVKLANQSIHATQVNYEILLCVTFAI